MNVRFNCTNHSIIFVFWNTPTISKINPMGLSNNPRTNKLKGSSYQGNKNKN